MPKRRWQTLWTNEERDITIRSHPSGVIAFTVAGEAVVHLRVPKDTEVTLAQATDIDKANEEDAS
jgi:hypothetical protein